MGLTDSFAREEEWNPTGGTKREVRNLIASLHRLHMDVFHFHSYNICGISTLTLSHYCMTMLTGCTYNNQMNILFVFSGNGLDLYYDWQMTSYPLQHSTPLVALYHLSLVISRR